MKTFYTLFSVVTLTFFITIYNKLNTSSVSTFDTLPLGNPSNSTSLLSDKNNYLISKGFYTLTYNESKHTPTWVYWSLSINDLGTIKRYNSFLADTSLPSSFSRIRTSCYNLSGFDRGHICPSADRTSSSIANISTFYLSNICPQSPTLNRGVWASLEEYCRHLVKNGHYLYIFAGQCGTGGQGSKGYLTKISCDISVPAYFYKIILITSHNNHSVSSINSNTPTISVVFKNDNSSKSHQWYNFLVTIDSIEHLTHYTFLTNLNDSITNKLKHYKYNFTH